MRQLLLTIGRGQDAGARCRADQDQGLRQALGGELLAKHCSHRVAEDDGRRSERRQKRLQLSMVIRHADAGEPLGVCGGVVAMSDQVGRMTRPPQVFEYSAETLEAPAAGIGAVQHHDVFGHAPLLIRLGSAACRRQGEYC